MSYYTLTDVRWNDSDRAAGDLSVIEIVSAARAYLQSVDWPDIAAKDLEDGLNNNGRVDPGFVDLINVQIIEMFVGISNTFRDVEFIVRGMGEEAEDIWLAKIRNGSVLEQHGPFIE